MEPTPKPTPTPPAAPGPAAPIRPPALGSPGQREPVLENIGYQRARFDALLATRGITSKLSLDDLGKLERILTAGVALLTAARDK